MEVSLGMADKSETLDDMFRALERGDYDIGLLDVVRGALCSSDPEAFFESLRKDIPDLLVVFFKGELSRRDKRLNSGAG